MPTNIGRGSGKSKIIWSLKVSKKGLCKKMASKRKTKSSMGPLLREGDIMKRDTGSTEIFSAILPQFCLVRLVTRHLWKYT